MDPQPAFTFQDLFTSVIGDMAKAISDRQGETQEQQFARSQAAIHMIMGFLPRDVIEAMLAGHCVMLHEVMTANVHDSLHGATDKLRRSNPVALNKAFNDNLDRLERYRLRPAEGMRDAPEMHPVESRTATANGEPQPRPRGAQSETCAGAGNPRGQKPQPPSGEGTPVAEGMNRAARRQAARAKKHAAATSSRVAPPKPAIPAQTPSFATRDVADRTEPGSLPVSPPEASIPYHPSPEVIAANPEATAALKAGDPERFARTLGIDKSGEAFLAAADRPGSPFDPHGSGPWPGEVATTPKA